LRQIQFASSSTDVLLLAGMPLVRPEPGQCSAYQPFTINLSFTLSFQPIHKSFPFHKSPNSFFCSPVCKYIDLSVCVCVLLCELIRPSAVGSVSASGPKHLLVNGSGIGSFNQDVTRPTLLPLYIATVRRTVRDSLRTDAG